MWGHHHHFQSRWLTSPALKTLKVMHFQRNAYWEQSCMIRWCPTQLHNSSRRAASLIQFARSKRSVDKVLLILTDLPHAALHATAPPKTQSTTALYWRLRDTEDFLSWFTLWKCKFLEKTGDIFHTESFWTICFFCPPREGLGLELLCWGYDHILAHIMRDVIPSELSKALLW